MNQFLDKDRVCEIAGGVSIDTVKKWEKAGIFPQRTKLSESVSRWSETAVAEWAEDPASWREEHYSATEGAV